MKSNHHLDPFNQESEDLPLELPLQPFVTQSDAASPEDERPDGEGDEVDADDGRDDATDEADDDQQEAVTETKIYLNLMFLRSIKND